MDIHASLMIKVTPVLFDFLKPGELAAPGLLVSRILLLLLGILWNVLLLYSVRVAILLWVLLTESVIIVRLTKSIIVELLPWEVLLSRVRWSIERLTLRTHIIVVLRSILSSVLLL